MIVIKIPIHLLTHASLPFSNPNIIHHNRLTVCLPDSLDLDLLSIYFVMAKNLWISWFPQLHFCRCCRNLEVTITIDKNLVIIKKFKFTLKPLAISTTN